MSDLFWCWQISLSKIWPANFTDRETAKSGSVSNCWIGMRVPSSLLFFTWVTECNWLSIFDSPFFCLLDPYVIPLATCLNDKRVRSDQNRGHGCSITPPHNSFLWFWRHSILHLFKCTPCCLIYFSCSKFGLSIFCLNRYVFYMVQLLLWE